MKTKSLTFSITTPQLMIPRNSRTEKKWLKSKLHMLIVRIIKFQELMSVEVPVTVPYTARAADIPALSLPISFIIQELVLLGTLANAGSCRVKVRDTTLMSSFVSTPSTKFPEHVRIKQPF